MSLKTVKRLVARVAGVGRKRVKILDAKKAEPALTADDARSLLKENAVAIAPVKGVGRSNARARQELRKRGRKRHEGSLRGTPHAHLARKDRWLRIVRAQRRLLKHLRPVLVKGSYRKLYRMVKGKAFSDKRRLLEFASSNKLLVQKK